jgi:hypothetical protein
MNEKTILTANPVTQSTAVVTQSVDAVKALLTFVGRASDPLPVDVALDGGRVVLVLNGKKDAFYTVTATACSCPAAHWHKGPCKHMRKHFPQSGTAKAVSSSGPLVPRGGFKPFSLLPSEEKAAKAASSLSVIDCHDTTPQGVAYWSIQEDKTMWPAEA